MNYDNKVSQLVEQFRAQRGSVGLNKKTSNLFRQRNQTKKQRLNVRGFNQVVEVDTKNNTIIVEGMTTFEDLTNAALEHGLVPLVVPELKTITVGGGVSGMAIESSSFLYGLAHESVLEMDVLIASGAVVTATATNQYKDLFFGLPNSYGTLGYVLKLKIKARPVKKFVHLQHLKFSDAHQYFAQLQKIAETKKYKKQPVSFLDGTVFGANEMYLTVGIEVDEAQHVSDYTYMKQYYRSIQNREEDYLTIYDYIWRWDTDWFWCSKNVFADRTLVRRVLGRGRLKSKTYFKLMQLEQRFGVAQKLRKISGNDHPAEDVIQDIEVPIDKAEQFLETFQTEIGISPIWVCPTKTPKGAWKNPLYPMQPDRLYINFGFWDIVPAHGNQKDVYYNKKVEDLVEKLGGMKSLYSSSFYEPARFDKLYGGAAYAQLKQKYDPKKRFKNLYEKTVKRG